jgi:hypothetical protein
MKAFRQGCINGNSVKAQAQKNLYTQLLRSSFLDVLIAEKTINQAALKMLLKVTRL